MKTFYIVMFLICLTLFFYGLWSVFHANSAAEFALNVMGTLCMLVFAGGYIININKIDNVKLPS